MASLEFVNEQEGKAAIAEVRKDGSGTDWCLFSYEGPKSNRLTLIGKGSGGISELVSQLTDEIIGYGLVRKTDRIDDSTTVKFAFIMWMGESVPRMQKAKVSVQQGAIRTWIGQFHVDITASSKDELSEEALSEKIMLTSGSGSRVIDKETGARTGGSRIERAGSMSGSPKTGSNELTFGNENELKAALQEVRKDDNDTNWTLFSYEGGNSNTVVFFGKGNGGLQELLSNLRDDIVGYALLRMVERIDESETIKFVYIRFVGDNIPRMLRARLGTHSGQITKLFSPYHVSLDATQLSELSEDIVVKAVKNAAGTSVHVLSEEQAASKGAARPTSNWTPRTTSGTTTNVTTKAPVIPKTLGQSQTIKFVDEQEVKDNIREVRRDDTDTDWVLVGYQGGKGNTLVTLGKGSGGLEEMLPLLNPTIVAYGLLRKTDKIDESLTIKFVFINFVGENIDRMHRARLGTYQGAVRDLFAPYHVDIDCTQVEELTEQRVMQRIQDASGSGSKVKN